MIPLRWLIVVSVCLGMVFAACDGEQPDVSRPIPERSPIPTDGPAHSPSQGELPEGWAVCTDEREGYAIGYPQDWHAEAPGLRDECTLFDPEPFEVERGTEAPLVAMTVDDQEVSFSQAANRLIDEERERVLEREPATVGAHDGIRFETIQTEDLLYPEGTRRYGYLIDDGGTAFFVRTISVPGAEMDYRNNKDVVDEAAHTVDFDV